MIKTTLFTLLTIGVSATTSGDAFAGGRLGCNRAHSYAAPAVGTTATGQKSSVNSQTDVKVTQTAPSSTYQSFSYESTVTRPAAAVQSRSVTRQPSSSFYDSVRGDRKVRGF